jgi:hypothetical protein
MLQTIFQFMSESTDLETGASLPGAPDMVAGQVTQGQGARPAQPEQQPSARGEDTATPDVYKTLFNECLRSLEDSYPDGLRAFTRKHHPSLHEQIEAAWDRIEETWGKDLDGFRVVLSGYTEATRRAIEMFGKEHE